jgi:hypothetical protein
VTGETADAHLQRSADHRAVVVEQAEPDRGHQGLRRRCSGVDRKPDVPSWI